MTTRGFLVVALHLYLAMAQQETSCPIGFNLVDGRCDDQNECVDEDYPEFEHPCGDNADCINTEGSFSCRCADGFASGQGNHAFTPESALTCKDINECLQNGDLCGPNALCHNSVPSYSCFCEVGFIASTKVEAFRLGDNVTCEDIDECHFEEACNENASCVNTQGKFSCVCNPGFVQTMGKSPQYEEKCEDICVIEKTICGNGTCHRGVDGHYCACHAGFTNYGRRKSPCAEINCDVFGEGLHLEQTLPAVVPVVSLLKNSCLELSESETPSDLDWKGLLERLLSMVDRLLSGGALNDNRKVSTLLSVVEGALRLVGPLTNATRVQTACAQAELVLQVQKGPVPPTGPLTLSSSHVTLQMQWETAAGEPSSYPGFTAVSLLSYKTLEDSLKGVNASFSGMSPAEGQRFQLNSKVATVTVSSTHTDLLKERVNLTFYHLEQSNGRNHTCVYWDFSESGGSWSPRGCSVVESGSNHTVCSCNHLSSFAVLMALSEVEDPFLLRMFTWVGLLLSLLCLLMCILTFSLVRSIQSTRTTIHLHLCISLFLANLVFLAGISRTENQVGCAVVAGLLHFFYLAAFCWMCLEGIQLFRMVVLVFNTTFRTLHMLVGGYGVAAVIVAVSAAVNSGGYGTKRHCWLNLEGGFIWSFFGPVCFIITVNILFFLITVWKLVQKLSSLNPDLNSLHKIKAFTITAVAQLCVLGTMWIFGCFQFGKSTIALSYAFTILNSLQGLMIFVMHCLLSKQVREEYGKFLSSLSVSQKKYSEFSSSQTSKAQTSKSIQHTGESHI